MNMEERLIRLERSNRRMKLFGGLLLTIFTGILLMGASHQNVQQVVKTKRLEVLDAQGNVHAVIGEVPLSTTTASDDKVHGFVLVSNEGKQVARLAMRKRPNSNTVSYSGLEVFDPEEGKELLFAGTKVFTHIGRQAEIDLDDLGGVYGMNLSKNSMRVTVKLDEQTSASAVTLYAKEDSSAQLSLGGIFEPFGANIFAEPGSSRLEIKSGAQSKMFGFKE